MNMFENDNQYPNVNYNSNNRGGSDPSAGDNHYNDYSHYYGTVNNQPNANQNVYGNREPDYTNAGSQNGSAGYTGGTIEANSGYAGGTVDANTAGSNIVYGKTDTGTDGINGGYEHDGYNSTVGSESQPEKTAYGNPGSSYGAPNGYTSYQSAYSYIPDEPVAKREKKSHKGLGKKILRLAGSGVIFGAVAGLVMVGILYVSPLEFPGNTENPETTASEKASQIEQSKLVDTGSSTTTAAVVTDVTDVVDEVMPSVVSITGLYKVEEYNPFGGYFGFSMPQESEQEGSGSGIIVGKNDEELLIATNYHVVEDATSLSVQFIDGETVDAQVKGTESDVDLAVIAVSLESIEDSTSSQIRIATLGDSDSLKVGEPAIAIGNALGYGQSVTTGVISAVDREYTQDGTTNYLVQTDAAINPGNSGGALINIRGEVVGINSNKIAGSTVEGMGYAIPISTAKPIIEELMTKQTRVKVDEGQKAFLGINGINVTEEVQENYGLPEGIYIAQVYENTAAANAGLTRGDILVEFDGEKVKTMEELASLLEYYQKGTTVNIVIMQGSPNGYQEKTITVTLGGRTDS